MLIKWLQNIEVNSFVKIQNTNWQKVWAGEDSVLEFIVQTLSVWLSSWFLEWVQLFVLMGIWTWKTYPVCYTEPTLIDKRSLMHPKEYLLLPEKVFQFLIKLCLGEAAAYDNMMISIRADTVMFHRSITLFTWETLIFKNTAHLYVQVNDKLFIVIQWVLTEPFLINKVGQYKLSSRERRITVFSPALIPPFNKFLWLGVASGIKFCPSCDTRKAHLGCGMLYDLGECDDIFWSLPGSEILRKYTLCLVSLDQIFFPLLGELRSMTTKCFSLPFAPVHDL